MPFFTILVTLNIDFLVIFSLLKVQKLTKSKFRSSRSVKMLIFKAEWHKNSQIFTLCSINSTLCENYSYHCSSKLREIKTISYSALVISKK